MNHTLAVNHYLAVNHDLAANPYLAVAGGCRDRRACAKCQRLRDGAASYLEEEVILENSLHRDGQQVSEAEPARVCVLLLQLQAHHPPRI